MEADMDRLPELAAEDMNDAQQRIFADIQSSRGGIRGPFPWLLRSPGLANIAQQVGAYLRYDSPLPGNLRELAILVVARFWAAQYEWHAHAPIAEREGVDPAIVEAIRENRRPDFTNPGEEITYNFCVGTLETHRVDDATYGAMLDLVGDEQLLDVIGILGYYSMLAIIMGTFDVPVPGDKPLSE
jgi:4-carboxymuconolactone decarboxylase